MNMGKTPLKTGGKRKTLADVGKSVSSKDQYFPAKTRERSMPQSPKPDEPSDEQLLIRFREKNDPQVIVELLDRYDRYVAFIAMPYMAQIRDIRDLKQDLYEKLWFKLQKHEPNCFQTWYGRLVRNHIYDKYYRKKREDIIEELPERAESTIKELDLSIDFQIVLDRIEDLKPDQRLYIELAFFGGMKNADICEHMGWSATKTRGLYDRSKKNLKKSLGDVFDELSGYFQDK